MTSCTFYHDGQRRYHLKTPHQPRLPPQTPSREGKPLACPTCRRSSPIIALTVLISPSKVLKRNVTCFAATPEVIPGSASWEAGLTLDNTWACCSSVSPNRPLQWFQILLCSGLPVKMWLRSAGASLAVRFESMSSEGLRMALAAYLRAGINRTSRQAGRMTHLWPPTWAISRIWTSCSNPLLLISCLSAWTSGPPLSEQRQSRAPWVQTKTSI